MREGSVRPSTAMRAVAVVAALWLAALALAACGADPSPPPPTGSAIALTRGAVPDSARRPDGSIDRAQLPDFISATAGDSTVGWIWAADAFPAAGADRVAIVTVYADDLATVIGHMYPAVGFVPLGAEDAMLPDPGRNRGLTLWVRNESDQPAVLEITAARDEVSGAPQLIAPPVVVGAGIQQQVTLRAPRDRWSLSLRGDPGFFFSDELGRRAAGDAGFALVIDPAGVVELGQRE